MLHVRDDLIMTEVNGLVFARGFIAFVITFAVVILLGVWFRKHQDNLDARQREDDAEAFDNMEEQHELE